MTNDYLDVKSPYIKSNVYSSIYDRGRRNTVSLNQNDYNRDSSDNFLEKKIHSVSKRIVGDEIRKFAEVASREISTEFNNLENRIKDHTENFKFNIKNQLKEEVELLGHNIGKELDIKIQELNSLINQTEDRLNNLENYSKDLSLKINSSSTSNNSDYSIEEEEAKPIFKINLNTESELPNAQDLNTKNIDYSEKSEINNVFVERENPKEININSYTNSVTNYQENPKTHELYIESETQIIKAPETHLIIEEVPTKIEDKPEAEKDYNKIIAKFNKKGFLFSKNTYPEIKDLLVLDIIDNKVEKVNRDDLRIIKDILNNLINETGQKAEFGDTVDEYLNLVCK